MGAGIAQVAARAGFEVVIRDVAPEFLKRGMTAIDKSLQREADKERLLADEKQSTLARIRTTTELGALRDAFIVVEAASEEVKIESESFNALSDKTRYDAVLASNTSAVS